MVHFVGAGSGAPDLITLRGARLLGEADVVIYAGSLVNPELLTFTKPGCELHDSAKLTLEEVIALIERAEREGKTTVRLHTGDPSIYGAVREQFDALTRGIDFDVCPGVSSFCGAAAALRAEYTLPNVSQTVIITRTAGRTPVPERESHPQLGRASGDDGAVLEHLTHRKAARRAPCRRLWRDNARGRRLQGDMAGGEDLPLHGGHAA